MNAAVSLAGLEPSTGVPKIRGSKVSIVEGNVPDISMMGAFTASAMAWAKRLVLPVLEKSDYARIHGLNSRWIVYLTFHLGGGTTF